MTYQAIDFFHLNEHLSSTEKMIQQSARDFVQHEVMPIIGEHFDKGTFPKHLVPMMAELGFLGSTIQGYGCAGVGDVAYGLIMTEIERGDRGLWFGSDEEKISAGDGKRKVDRLLWTDRA